MRGAVALLESNAASRVNERANCVTPDSLAEVWPSGQSAWLFVLKRVAFWLSQLPTLISEGL
jgi:hypothetical protein